ncbi:organic cation transporter protein-like [Pararge aegeria]|uniref:Jg15624 protein n=1 Tax=Pararge aegeria aegeria TaxID=348720 RepID=A0A8S4RUB7_9NEOP|nr:organic cation transporter protein-like [Pararge aegeria]CAH2241427.1 jg15624 [Pararge aegeria aegeria]
MESKKNETDKLFVEEVPKAKVSLEVILIQAIGQFGGYQLRMLVLAAVLAIFTAFSSMEYVFSTARINTRCLIPECESSEAADFKPPWILNAVPTRDGSFDSCLRFKPDNKTAKSGTCIAEWFDHNETISCSAYIYENKNTIVYDYGLACDEWRRTVIGAVHTFGGLLALPITGYVSDRWGRRVALVINAANTAWLGVVRYLCSGYYVFLLTEILKSTLGGGVYSCAYILVMELVGPKYRVAAGAALSTCISSGHFLLGALAWAVPDWRHLILTIYIPHFLFISYYWIMSESVRWNMSKGRYKEVESFLKRVARVNKRELSEKLLQELKESVDTKEQLKTFEDKHKEKEPWLIVLVFRNKEILKRCCISPVWWVTFTLIYYGLSINSVNMAGNRYLNLMVVAASEIPGYWLALLLMDRIGRKPVLIGAFWTCAACQLAYIFLSNNMYAASLSVYLIGKFTIAIVMMSLYIYTAEIFPTRYRHSLMAFSSMIGRIGSVVAPLTPAFGASIWHHFPSALFCGFALLAGALVFLAPETLGTKLPDTMEEAAVIGVKREKQRDEERIDL